MVPLDAGVDRHHCQHGDGAGVIRRRHIRKRSSYLLDTVIVLVGLFLSFETSAHRADATSSRSIGSKRGVERLLR
jgi:hypothetical protein